MEVNLKDLFSIFLEMNIEWPLNISYNVSSLQNSLFIWTIESYRRDLKKYIGSKFTEVKSRLIIFRDKVAFNNILFPFSLENSPRF